MTAAPWVGLFVLIAGALALDLGVHHRRHRPLGLGGALAWSSLWIVVALGFGLVVWHLRGPSAALQYYTAYLLEKSLSFDNLLVFLLVFESFKTPPGERHRVLTWGILGALGMRAAMIFGGVELLELWHPVIYVFAAFLIYSGVRTLAGRDEHQQPITRRRFIRWLERRLPIVPRYEGSRFFVRDENGKRAGTLLLFVLVVVEAADVLFAVDSIPAVLGISHDMLIVFSSNVLAMLGLRALYSVVEYGAARLHYLRYGVGIILVVIGLKMGSERFVDLPAWASLAITVGILLVTVIASLIHKRRATAPAPPPPDGHGGSGARASSPAPRGAAAGRS